MPISFLVDAMNESFDVIIVGARCAGTPNNGNRVAFALKRESRLLERPLFVAARVGMALLGRREA